MPTQEFHDACLARFDDDGGLGADVTTSLPRLGRKLYIGFGGAGGYTKSVLPRCELHMLGDETLDAFGLDVEGGAYQFSLFTDSRKEDAAYALRKNVIRVFDNALIVDGSEPITFTTAAFERLPGGIGPRIVDGAYMSTLNFRVLIQLVTQNPATRYA